MKKSNIYRTAQLAVVKDEDLSPVIKLCVIRELQRLEELEIFIEEKEEADVEEN